MCSSDLREGTYSIHQFQSTENGHCGVSFIPTAATTNSVDKTHSNRLVIDVTSRAYSSSLDYHSNKKKQQ